ncbi:phage protein [Sodalis sp. RH18]|uniref:phage protein n=1 Tax=Sodalis sp. RH18 TaxID=3394333 RepID=UPI0039B44139
MTARISGLSFDVDIGDAVVHVKNISLSITDNTAVATTRGIPDGHIEGDVAADGEIELDTKNFLLLQAKAAAAGSWRGIDVMDFAYYAKAGTEEIKVESFGNKLSISDLLSIDPTSNAAATHKIKYFVTSPDFVHINGIPYLSANDTRDLIG